MTSGTLVYLSINNQSIGDSKTVRCFELKAACIKKVSVFGDPFTVSAIGLGNSTIGYVPSGKKSLFNVTWTDQCLRGFHGDMYGEIISSLGFLYEPENKE